MAFFSLKRDHETPTNDIKCLNFSKLSSDMKACNQREWDYDLREWLDSSGRNGVARRRISLAKKREQGLQIVETNLEPDLEINEP